MEIHRAEGTYSGLHEGEPALTAWPLAVLHFPCALSGQISPTVRELPTSTRCDGMGIVLGLMDVSASEDLTALAHDSRQDSFAQQIRRETLSITPPLSPGDIWADRYRILRLLGQGGMGDVYEAAHVLAPALRFAVKVLRASASEELARRLLREASSIARVRHRHVVSVTDVGITASGIPYLVMEFVGDDLQEYAQRRGGVLAAKDAVEFCAQICDALAAAHAQGIIHRDIKPRNCLVHRELDTEYIVVSDFGLARSMDGDDSPSREWTFAGSRGYMAPEVLLGHTRPDHRVDIYGVGATLFCLLTGSPPSPELGEKTTFSRQLIGKTVPRSLLRILLRTLAFDANRRYHSVRELGAALRKSLPMLSEAASKGHRTRVPIALLCGATLASLAILLLLIVPAAEVPLRPEPSYVLDSETWEQPAVLPSSRSLPLRAPDIHTNAAAMPEAPAISEGRPRGAPRRPVELNSGAAELPSELVCERLHTECRSSARIDDLIRITLINRGTDLRIEDTRPLWGDRTLLDCVTLTLKKLCRDRTLNISQCHTMGQWVCDL